MSGRNSATFERPVSSLAHRTDDGSTNRRLRQFRDHWLSVLGAFMELRRARVPVHIENTELTYRMERMWRLLFEDATEGAGNLDPAVVCAPTLPPCWSFAAREGILGDIAGYASIDLPCGMLEYTLGWFERLLTDLACMDVVELLGNTGRRYVAKLQTTAWRPVEQLLIDAGAALYVCEPSEEDVDTMVPFLSLGQSVLDVAADAFSGQTSLLLARLQSEVAIAVMRVALQCIRYDDVRVRRLAQPIILELLGAVQRQQHINLSRNLANGRLTFAKHARGNGSNASCYGRDESVSDDDSDAGDSLMATLLEETGVMNVLTGLLRKAFMALVLHASTSHAATSHINETNDDESSAQRDTEARRKIFWQRWRLVHDVYRLAREKYSSPLMRHSIEHAIHRNVLVYVRAAVTRRPTPEAIEALECVTDILRSIEDDYNLLHLLLDATFLMPSCAAAVSRMVASRDDRISIAALWAIHETIRLGDPSAVSDLMRSHKDSSYRLLDCSNSTANMPDSATIEQTLQISQRMLALSEMIDEGGALHASCASRKGPVMEYVRAAFDRCATRLELKEQYNTFFEGAQQSHAHALRRQIWAGVSHVGLLEQLMEQLSQPLTASFSRNLLVTSVLAQLIAMQDNVDLNRVLSNSNLPTVKRARHLTGYTLGSRNILQSLEQVTNDILNYADSVPAFDIRLKIARISPWRQNSQAAKKAGVSVVRPFGDGSFGGQGRPTPRRRVARCPTLSTIREANIESINMQAVSNTPIHAPQARRQPTIVKDSLPDAYQPVPVPPPRVLDSSTPPTPVPMDDDLNMERSFEHNAARARMNLAMMESDDDDESGSTEMPSQILKNEKEYTTEMNSNPTFKQQSFLTTSDSLVSNPITTTTTTAIATSNKMRRTTAARPKIRVKPPSPVSTRITRSSSVRDPRQPSVEQLVQTALVISEFCKEVACLILVKPLNRIVRCNEHWSKEQHEHYSQLTESLGLNRL